MNSIACVNRFCVVFGAIAVVVSAPSYGQMFSSKAEPKVQIMDATKKVVNETWSKDCSPMAVNIGSVPILKYKWPGVEHKRYLMQDGVAKMEKFRDRGWILLSVTSKPDSFGVVGEATVKPSDKALELSKRCKSTSDEIRIYAPVKYSIGSIVDLETFKAGVEEYAVVSFIYDAIEDSEYRRDYCAVFMTATCSMGTARKARMLFKSDKFDQQSPWKYIASDFGSLKGDFLSSTVSKKVSELKFTQGAQ